MPEGMSHHNSVSDESRNIARRFANEANRGSKLPPNAVFPPKDKKTVDFVDYQTMCYEMIGAEKLLTEGMLEREIKKIMTDSKLKLKFEKGNKCVLAVMPFDNFGDPLTAEEIRDGKHLRIMRIDENGKTVGGFGGNSYVTDFLPPEVQKVEFTIGEYDKPGLNDITDEDRKRIAEQMRVAFAELKKLMGA